MNKIFQFQKACERNDIEAAKIFFNPEYAEWGLRAACEEGHLKIAKWLVSLGANIHMKEELPLRLACIEGYLEMVQWLVSLDADIHAHNDDAFISACKKNRIEIVQFLSNLCPRYYVNIENGYITQYEVNDFSKNARNSD